MIHTGPYAWADCSSERLSKPVTQSGDGQETPALEHGGVTNEVRYAPVRWDMPHEGAGPMRRGEIPVAPCRGCDTRHGSSERPSISGARRRRRGRRSHPPVRRAGRSGARRPSEHKHRIHARATVEIDRPVRVRGYPARWAVRARRLRARARLGARPVNDGERDSRLAGRARMGRIGESSGLMPIGLPARRQVQPDLSRWKIQLRMRYWPR